MRDILNELTAKGVRADIIEHIKAALQRDERRRESNRRDPTQPQGAKADVRLTAQVNV